MPLFRLLKELPRQVSLPKRFIVSYIYLLTAISLLYKAIKYGLLSDYPYKQRRPLGSVLLRHQNLET